MIFPLKITGSKKAITIKARRIIPVILKIRFIIKISFFRLENAANTINISVSASLQILSGRRPASEIN